MLLNPLDRQRGPTLVMTHDLALQSYLVVGVDSVLANNANGFRLRLVVGIADVEVVGCNVTSLTISSADVVTEGASLGTSVSGDDKLWPVWPCLLRVPVKARSFREGWVTVEANLLRGVDGRALNGCWLCCDSGLVTSG